jgi:hypothetical protein
MIRWERAAMTHLAGRRYYLSLIITRCGVHLPWLTDGAFS